MHPYDAVQFDPPAQEIDSGFHFFLECIGLPTRKCEQAGPVRILETVHVTTVRRGFALGMHVLNNSNDHATTAGSGKPANKEVVPRSGEFHAHL